MAAKKAASKKAPKKNISVQKAQEQTPELTPDEIYGPGDDDVAGLLAKEADAAKINLNDDPGLATNIFNRITETNAAALSGGKRDLFPRQEIDLIIDGSECAPNVFCDEDGVYYDFKITLRSLSSAEELDVFSTSDVTEDQVGGAFQMAKKSFYKMNGTKMKSDQKDLLWELLGPKGRQLVMRGFGEISQISPAAVGKLRSVSLQDLELED